MDVLKQTASAQPPVVDRPPPANRAPWPKRVRVLLDEIRSHGCAWLQAPLRRTLADFDQQLFVQAERARNHLDQQTCFESRQALQQGQRDFEALFHAELVEGFHNLDKPTAAEADQAIPATLALVDPEEQEQSAALSKLAARGESRNGTLLFELGYRFAALLGSPPLEGQELPLGPQALTRALHKAIGGLPNLPARHRIQLLSAFDGGLMAQLEPLYQTVNERLIAGGILPQLRAFPHSRPAMRAATAPAQASARPPVSEAKSAAHDEPSPAAAPASAAAAAHSENIAILENLRELLAQQRTPARASASLGGHAATSEELQTALVALQHHLADVTDQAAREIRSAKRLREELLVQLNTNRAPGASPLRLSTEQSDTVELIAMLFEQLGVEVHSREQAISVLSRLQLPLLRVAITDHDFFSQREHPARKLLDTVAETADRWLDVDGQLDHALASQLEQLLERANREPPSAALYAQLLGDMEQNLANLIRKSRAAERRQIEAMQGRERLEQARQRATALIAERVAQHPPRGLLRVLLDRAWADVLALTLLRHGEKSATFQTQLQVTDQLLGRSAIEHPLQLRADIETGLQQIGMHQEEAAQVAAKLLGQERTENPTSTEAQPAATDLAVRLKQRQRLGESAANETTTAKTAAIAAPEVTATAALNESEQSMLKHLLQLPFGSWLEFRDNASATAVQRKLAWYSPISGRCLLVTRRGARGEEMSVQQLARELASGRVRELAPGREGTLDRAWTRMVSQLQRLGLRGQSQMPSAVISGA